jgi:hypothetical protein
MTTTRSDDGAFEALLLGDIRRANFISRLLGLFSEEIVRYWCADSRAPYEDLGRPTLLASDDTRGHTLDFTLHDRSTHRTYIAELKCELAFENFKYLRLRTPSQLAHHTGAAFTKFIASARDPLHHRIRVAGRDTKVNGAILVWGAMTAEGKENTMAQYGFADVLSVEDMLSDLGAWKSPQWEERVGELRSWSTDLFTFLCAWAGA